MRFEKTNNGNSRRKSFKAPLPRRSFTILWSWKNWRCLRHSVRRKQSRLREEPWYSRPTDLFVFNFGRIIITGQSRKIEVKDMLQHNLGPMPAWALTSTAEKFSSEEQQGGIGYLTAKECPASWQVTKYLSYGYRWDGSRTESERRKYPNRVWKPGIPLDGHGLTRRLK